MTIMLLHAPWVSLSTQLSISKGIYIKNTENKKEYRHHQSSLYLSANENIELNGQNLCENTLDYCDIMSHQKLITVMKFRLLLPWKSQ